MSKDFDVVAVDMTPQEIWNAAINAAARTARTWGPPHWSWSESSLIINDTCGEISEQILKLKKDIKNG